jgi:hypothetical protein
MCKERFLGYDEKLFALPKSHTKIGEFVIHDIHAEETRVHEESKKSAKDGKFRF